MLSQSSTFSWPLSTIYINEGTDSRCFCLFAVSSLSGSRCGVAAFPEIIYAVPMAYSAFVSIPSGSLAWDIGCGDLRGGGRGRRMLVFGCRIPKLFLLCLRSDSFCSLGS